MRILALEPYAAMSHMAFLEGLQSHSRYTIEIDALPARKWKWRMRTAAIHFAARVAAAGPVDVLLVSDFLNLAELRGLLPASMEIPPAIVYFHENQLTYPLPDYDERDYDFTLDHLYSILASTRTLFNSTYHRDVFLNALPEILRLFPDMDGMALLGQIEDRCGVLPLGTDAERCVAGPGRATNEIPVIVWNHRWEHDKNPDGLVAALLELETRGVPFKVRVLGQRFRDQPEAFKRLEALLGPRLEHVGFVADRTRYLEVLAGGDIVFSTAHHEFFGLSALEGIRLGLLPVLPDDLAYPELLPEGVRKHPFLYRRERVADALVAACEMVRSGSGQAERKRLLEHSAQFSWDTVARQFDQVFAAVSDPRPETPRADR